MAYNFAQLFGGANSIQGSTIPNMMGGMDYRVGGWVIPSFGNLFGGEDLRLPDGSLFSTVPNMLGGVDFSFTASPLESLSLPFDLL